MSPMYTLDWVFFFVDYYAMRINDTDRDETIFTLVVMTIQVIRLALKRNQMDKYPINNG